MKRGVFVLGFLILILMSVSYAQTLESYSVDYQVSNGVVYVSEEFVFGDYEDLSDFELVLPADIKDVKIYVDDEEVESLTAGESIRVDYKTSEFVEDEERFLTSFKSPLDSKVVEARVILPEGVILAKDIENSVFPYPTNVGSDGKRIFVEWTKGDVKQGEDFSFFVMYKQGFQFNDLWYGIIIGVIIALVIVYIVVRKKKKKVAVKKKVKKHKFEAHLKEDEEQVINILKKKGGECEQGTLVVVSDFSKAKMSRILKELEERKIIKKIGKGKKNRIILKAKI